MKKLTSIILLLTLYLQLMALEKTPIGFIENKGQWPNEVTYLFQSNGVNAWITNHGVVYDFHRVVSSELAENDQKDLASRITGKLVPPQNIVGHIVGMSLEGGNQNVRNSVAGLNSHTYNYFLGNDSSKWATDVKSSQEVTLHNIYPGIDLRYYTDKGALRYDFIVHPRANPSDIKWSVKGAPISTNSQGQLVFKTVLGEVKQAELLSYQTINSKKHKVESSFRVKGTTVSFEVDGYDHSQPLIIDPVLYATYLGGPGLGDEELNAIHVTPNGERIILGHSPNSANYPTTTGSYSQTNAGERDMIVSKINSTGNALIYSSFIGGSGDDYSILGTAFSHLNADGSIIFTATTNSANFPTVVGAFETDFGGVTDAVVVKLGANGNSLGFSTFFGSAFGDYGISLDIDSDNNIYLIGATLNSPNDFPITSGAYDQTPNGQTDVFVSKFNSSASTLIYSTLIGGGGDDTVFGAKLDAQNNMVIAGATRSGDFPTTSGAFNEAAQLPGSGFEDVFVTKLNATGSALLASTFLGGTFDDLCYALDIASDGSIVILGQTQSDNFPVLQSHQSVKNGNRDIFLSKLNSSLSSLVFSTYYGGSSIESGKNVKVDIHGAIYIIGYSASSDFEVTSDAVQSNLNGEGDVILAKFSETGGLLYSTYYGGNGIGGTATVIANEDDGFGLWVDNLGTAHICGRTLSDGFPVTPVNVQNMAGIVVAQPSNVTGEGFVLTINTCATNFSTAEINTPVCENSSVNLVADGGTNYSWTGPNGYSSNQQNPTFSATSQSAGTYTVTVTNLGCASTIEVTLVVDPALNTNIIGPSNVDQLTPTSFVVSQNLGSTYTWSITNGTLISGQGTNSTSITFPIEGTATVMVTEVNGNCSETTSITVNVGCTSAPNPPAITGSATADENTTGAYSVPAQSGYSYTWTVTGGNIISGQGTNAISVQWGNEGAGTVSIVWADANGCESTPTNLNVTIAEPSGIFDYAKAEPLSVFPNPSNGLFYLNITDTKFTSAAEVTVMDNTGRVVYRLNATNQMISIDLNTKAEGIYLVKVREGELFGTTWVSVSK